MLIMIWVSSVIIQADLHGSVQETGVTHTYTQEHGVTPGQLVQDAEALKIEAPYKLRVREKTDWIWLIILTE